MSDLVAKRLRDHAVRYANDYGYNVASDLNAAAARIEALEAALRDVKTNALNCQPADVPAALAHIIRLCIDALAPEQNK